MRQLQTLRLAPTGEVEILWLDGEANFRETRCPGDSLGDLPADDTAEVVALWTPAFVAAWKAERGIEQPVSLGQALAAARAELDAIYDELRQQPFEHDFGTIHGVDDAGVDHGPVGVQTLQMRDTAINPDLRNWLARQTNNAILLLAGQGDEPAPLKATSNLWVQTTVAEGAPVLGAVFARQNEFLAAYGAHKLALAAAESVAAVQARDLLADWP